MYRKGPTPDELEAAGLTEADFASEAVEPWPDNLVPLLLFQYLRTQWRTGAGGPSGLDYTVMHRKMDRMGLTPDDYDQLEHDIQIMEVAAINCIYAKT
ncbi:DUF1799 domain-containing protein [Massilia antarctica]|uniref:DUF1799 domain-containing protein n=1 Tax=Massilia antarctica TaxID=2765360 RepID=A0AA48WJR0_9BURK|nr:DUF1799 domain-containing protein [Massilia antarctica]QPI52927.1 DUF1799 domain-containing protein [Massilia antarctica]CUI09840.1 Phage protein [Janthinobacterium sp. CG23_2]CUU33626.1 Phage protein [Janthinobacterium sp. CG23_2]